VKDHPSKEASLKPSSLRKLFVALAATACLVPPAIAEDLDLFTQPPPTSAGDAPNILIIIDNSANWARNDQGWPLEKQGESELKALSTVIGSSAVGVNVNIGLMMFTTGAPHDGGYVRFAISSMNAANKAAFIELIGTSTCVDGPNSVTGGANCILKNFQSTAEKTNSASTDYSATMFEAFKYFGGWTDPSNANSGLSPNPPNVVNASHFGLQRYAHLDGKADRRAYTDGTMTVYQPPIPAPPAPTPCGKNYIIFIGNGYPSTDADPSVLTGIFGNPSVPPPIGNKSVRSANWAKYLFSTDVSPASGRQRVNTYTIDVYKDHQDFDQTALLQGMAKYGGGTYFAATSSDAIVKALQDIIVEIQAVNSVFASASLPINATNRSQNENQVFIGMFRPDGDAHPRWYGNLKQFQIALFGGDAKLADKNGAEAISATTGFLNACSASFWGVDSGNYWDFSASSQGTCTTAGTSISSDLPDGPVVEKGGTAEVVRRGNNPAAAAPFAVSRNMLTCAASPCAGLVPISVAAPSLLRTGAADATQQAALIDYTFGKDVNNENGEAPALVGEPRPSIHGDIAHSRPLPVNFGAPRKVVIYYGGNDGVFRAVEGATGKELWSFIAPEHHAKLKRLYLNDPPIVYPGVTMLGAVPKDYFFDGSAGLYQNGDNSQVWIYPTMRRGGRMVYAFDVSGSGLPVLKWSRGCPNMGDDTGCSTGFDGIGQTWSTPNPAFVKGYGGGSKPVVIFGGGYDACEDADVIPATCTAAAKGRRVYILDGDDGSVLGGPFVTLRPVAADVTLIDRDFDGLVDHVYVNDTGGNVYRIDLVDPATKAPLAKGAWTMTRIAATTAGNRKFLFGSAALVVGDNVYLAMGTGDREKPLISNTPYASSVQNRFYMFIDKFPAPGTVNLDGATMTDYTSDTTCSTVLAAGQDGWFMDLTAGRGEQVVTSSVIFGGTIFFSTNRPVPTVPGTCSANLGEAQGYALNLLNASGVIGTGKLCGGDRNGVFTGGGIPPSPVVGTVPVRQPDGTFRSINILIGGIGLDTGGGSVIGAQQPPIPIKEIRSRIYWYPHGDK
jgi:type IV pilus assembly protein PilY1